MLSPLLAIVAWLACGHAVLGGLFWTLLQVPESTVFTVALSVLLAVMLLVATGWVEVAAQLSWTESEAPARRIRRAAAAVPAFLVSLALFALVFWLTARAGQWLIVHRGEIDAWLIAGPGIVKSSPIHAALGWVLWFVRYGLGLSVALTLLGQLTVAGVCSIAQPAWLCAALRPRRLALVALSIFVFVWLPWQAVYWRPGFLPPTWFEPAFVAVKLLVFYLVANLGWALALKVTAAARHSKQD
jgi:hypothetical protein